MDKEIATYDGSSDLRPLNGSAGSNSSVNTNWSEIPYIYESEENEPRLSERARVVLNNILCRFQKQLTDYFTRRFQKFDPQAVYPRAAAAGEEMFTDFAVYLVENRCRIFCKADPNKGKLRCFLYVIARRFANKYLEQLSLQPFVVGVCLGTLSTEDPRDRDEFDIDYVNTILKRVLLALKREDKSQYYLLKDKYWKLPVPSSAQLAVRHQLLSEDQYREYQRIQQEKTEKRLNGAVSSPEVKLSPEQQALCDEVETACNNIDQRLSRARNKFRELLRKEIKSTLAYSNPAEKQQALNEEMKFFKRYIGDTSMEVSDPAS